MLLFFSGFMLEKMQDKFINPEKKVQHFQKVLSGKEKKMKLVMDLASRELENNAIDSDCIESGKI